MFKSNNNDTSAASVVVIFILISFDFLYARGVFKTLPNIYQEAFCENS